MRQGEKTSEDENGYGAGDTYRYIESDVSSHLGKSFTEACDELGLTQEQQRSLARLQEEMAHHASID